MTDRISIRGVAVATSVVLASTALTVAVHAVASEPEPSASAPVTRIDKLPGAGQAASTQRLDRSERAGRGAPRIASSSGARGIAASIAASTYGWGAGQFSCLDSLWERESGWDVHASNSSSGAYGIPQALPGSKMSAYGGDWRNSAATQVEWGLDYIADRYGDPCGAWDAVRSKGWY